LKHETFQLAPLFLDRPRSDQFWGTIKSNRCNGNLLITRCIFLTDRDGMTWHQAPVFIRRPRFRHWFSRCQLLSNTCSKDRDARCVGPCESFRICKIGGFCLKLLLFILLSKDSSSIGLLGNSAFGASECFSTLAVMDLIPPLPAS